MIIVAHINHSLPLSFWGGFTHPLTGWDHLVMLISVGLIAVRYQNDRVKIITTLLLGLLFGGSLGAVLGAVGLIEILIGITLAIGGLFLIQSRRERRGREIVFGVATVGLIHGLAHGGEMNGLNPIPFFGGMVTCAFLMTAGVGLLFTIWKNQWRREFAFCGVTIVMCGLIKAIGAV